MTDFQYTDLVILALVAVFIALRLRNTLGKDIGHKPDVTPLRRQKPESQEDPAGLNNRLPVEEKPEDDKEEKRAREAIGDPALMAGIDAIIKADPSFSISGFIEGAKGAFEWVLKAYRQGDTDTLKQLLAPSVYEEFKSALEAAKSAEHKTETTLVAINHAEITGASLEKNRARIAMRILSDQIEITRDTSGNIVGGDASRVETVEDEWVFERDIKSRNPNWVIIDT